MKTLKLFTFLILTSFFANAQVSHVISALVLTNNYQNVVPNIPVLVIDSSSGALPVINIYNYITDVNGQFQDSIITAGTSGTLWFLAPDSCGFATMAISYSSNSPFTLATAGIILCNNIIVNPLPNCNYTVSALPVAGFPNQAFFNYSGQVGSTFLWTFGDGTSSNQPNAFHTYAQAGTYTYCLQIDSCTPVCGTITVFNSGGCDPFFFPVTNGATVDIYPSLITGQFQLVVDWGDGIQDTFTPLNIPSIPNTISHTYAAPGNYQICLTHSNAQLGCSNTSCNSVTITNTNQPICNASFIVDTVNSQGGSVVLWNNTSILNVTPTMNIQFMWDFGDGSTSTQQFPMHQYANPGVYSVCLTVSATDPVTSISCTSTFCDSLGMDANGNLIYKGAATGFTLNVMDPNSIGVDENILDAVTIFPNPVNDFLQIFVPENISGEAMYEVFSVNGQVLLSEKISDNNLSTKLDVSNLPSGLYILNIRVNAEIKQFKIIKQ